MLNALRLVGAAVCRMYGEVNGNRVTGCSGCSACMTCMTELIVKVSFFLSKTQHFLIPSSKSQITTKSIQFSHMKTFWEIYRLIYSRNDGVSSRPEHSRPFLSLLFIVGSDNRIKGNSAT